MGKDFRLSELNLLDNKHFPVIAFFNAISDYNFLDVVHELSLGNGYGINATVCTFPHEADSDEEEFEGIKFSLHDDEVIVDHNTFFYYFNLASSEYVKDFPDAKESIKRSLDEIVCKFKLHN
jgi:hypothetical protein